MSSFALRFVGQDALPSRLSEFDREQFFELGSADVEAITQQFRVSHRLPAALMVLFMRATGRPLDGFNVLPRNLLRHTAELLGISPPAIATLRSIYKRSQTLFKHQLWAKTYLGLRDLEGSDEIQLADALRIHAQEATHPDELVRSTCQWLYTRRIVIPGVRRLKDWARDALAAVEASVLLHVSAAVPVARARELSALAYCIRPETDSTQLEWLKTPPRRHGPSSLAETLEKVRQGARSRHLGPEQRDAGQAAGVRQAGAVAAPGQDARDQPIAADDRVGVFSADHAS